MGKFISVKDLTYKYARDNADGTRQEITALLGVTFDVDQGEFLAIIGKNGSGKSTLAKCLNALFLPDSGKVTVNGWDTADMDHVWDIRQSCAMVFQNPDNQLVSSIVEDDVAFGPENMGIDPKVIRERVRRSLDIVGMRDQSRKSPHLLSGGQKQKVAIAGALAMMPECIVFDEPTAMLDPKGRSDIMNTINELRADGMTIILITHFMEEAALADHIMVMDRGKVAGYGTPKEIFSDRTLIEERDIELPMAALLADKLRGLGMDVPEVVSEDELISALTDSGKSVGAEREDIEDN